MSKLVRFGVSIEKELLHSFDGRLHDKKYANRSEAIRDLIRGDLVKREWQENRQVTGAIMLVYNHHKRELLNQLTELQHDYHNNILSTQHIHLDSDNCLEVIAIRGKAKEIEELYRKLRSAKGVKHAEFAMSTTGKKVI